MAFAPDAAGLDGGAASAQASGATRAGVDSKEGGAAGAEGSGVQRIESGASAVVANLNGGGGDGGAGAGLGPLESAPWSTAGPESAPSSGAARAGQGAPDELFGGAGTSAAGAGGAGGKGIGTMTMSPSPSQCSAGGVGERAPVIQLQMRSIRAGVEKALAG